MSLPDDVFHGAVANVSAIVALDRSFLTDHVGRLSAKPMVRILHGIDVILGR